uniref:Uncharacterized protein n=1 Tax=Sphaerodactylus townsendi TaxID=933632 RepID=A0ACB8EFV2_9SAUR
MAVEFSRDKPWAAAICTICVKYFTDPVSLECGHNFCRSCITRCWEELHASICCPRWCHYFLEGRKFEPNRELADFVEATKQRVEQVKEEAKEWANCGEHRKPLNLFCEDDQAAICEDCMKLEAHRNHCVVGVEISHQIDAYINVPREMESAFTLYSYNTGKKTDEWLKRVEAERKRTLAKFKHLRQCLDELENLRLARLVELEKEITEQRDQHGEKIDRQIDFLIEIEDDMADYYFKPREFLQDFGHGLPSYEEELLEDAVLVPTGVKDKIQKFCDQKLFLEEVLDKFNGNEEFLQRIL